MIHNVENQSSIVNNMDQDVALGVVGTVAQAELAQLRGSGLLGEYAVVYRVIRYQQGGGYGDQDRHPFCWAVAVYVNGQLYRIRSARGSGREWSSLDRLSHWLRQQGFWNWWTRNDLEPVGMADVELDELADQ